MSTKRALSFTGHESFPLRYGWLKKGYEALRTEPEFFLRPDAMVTLGVGKNMVRAIRHWGLACEVWEEIEGGRGRALRPTAFGTALFNDAIGWDPYVEDPASVWWLHWRLTRNPTRATAWSYMFAERSGATRFSRDQLTAELNDLQRGIEGRTTPISSLRRDVDVLIRSYAGSSKRSATEDVIDSLFGQLGLIRPASEKGAFEIISADWASLPALLVAAAILEYQSARPERRAIPLDELLYNEGSPGRIFRLTETGFIRRLLALPTGWQFDETAGLRQVIVPAGLTALQLLEHHYLRIGQEAA